MNQSNISLVKLLMQPSFQIEVKGPISNFLHHWVTIKVGQIWNSDVEDISRMKFSHKKKATCPTCFVKHF